MHVCLGFRLGPWPQGTCSGLGALEPFGSLGLDGVCRLLLATLSFGSLGWGWAWVWGLTSFATAGK